MNVFREFMKGKNVGRILINRVIEKHVRLDGLTLELGSTQKMSYYRFIDTSKTKIFMADLTKTKDVSLVLDLESKLPFKDNSVDNIVILSVLEHVYNPYSLLEEMHRVLKKDGVLYLSIPFMVFYHPSPHDYSRYTKEKLERMLKEFQIERLETIGGFFTVFDYHFTGYFVSALKMNKLKNLIRYMSYVFSQSLDRKISKIKKDYKERFPMSYFIVAKKRS